MALYILEVAVNMHKKTKQDQQGAYIVCAFWLRASSIENVKYFPQADNLIPLQTQPQIALAGAVRKFSLVHVPVGHQSFASRQCQSGRESNPIGGCQTVNTGQEMKDGCKKGICDSRLVQINKPFLLSEPTFLHVEVHTVPDFKSLLPIYLLLSLLE